MKSAIRNTLRWHSYFVRNGFIIGAIAGIFYAIVEDLIETTTLDEFSLLFLLKMMLRGFIIGSCIGTSIGLFEALTVNVQRKYPVWKLFIIKTIYFVLIINFLLLAINALYLFIDGRIEGFPEYLSNSFIVNSVFGILVSVLMVTYMQVSKLHRRNELKHFIFGRYHNPVNENILLFFTDLKGSTSLAESMGNVKYANFLKDYYADISDPIFECKGDVYQYVGDEIIVYWKARSPEKNLRSVRCHQLIEQKIQQRESYYLNKYGHVPSFRTSLHAGSIVITWVGEVRREILFIGDVLNTCARMQDMCKQLGKDFLLSGETLEMLPTEIASEFKLEETIVPRGKHNEIQVYSRRKVN